MDLAERSADSGVRHPWEVVRSKFFQRLCGRFCDLSSETKYLDVGAGDAWFASQFVRSLPDVGRFVCWDVHYSPEELSELGMTLPGSLRLTNSRPEGRFDVLLLLDVLEHVDDDREFLHSLVSDSLAADGTVVISVPAWQSLFSSHDRLLRHYRRYSPRQCNSLMTSAGLRSVAQGGLFHTLLPVRAAQVVLERFVQRTYDGATAAGRWKGGPGLTRVVTSVLQAEASASFHLGVREHAIPGLSYWAVARRV